MPGASADYQERRVAAVLSGIVAGVLVAYLLEAHFQPGLFGFLVCLVPGFAIGALVFLLVSPRD